MEVRLHRVNYGLIRVSSNAPEIAVNIDGKGVGQWRSGEAPLEVKLASGKHKLSVSADGRKRLEDVIDVPRGQVLPIHAHLIPKYPRGAAWTQAAIGAAFVGAAVYFGTESNRLHDDLQADRKKGVLDQEDDRITRGRWYAIGADAGFVIGGVLGVLATYNFIKDPLPDSSTRLSAPVEFDDPRNKRPTAWLPGRQHRRLARKRKSIHELDLRPALGTESATLSIGGAF
jgi:hypothetical protein